MRSAAGQNEWVPLTSPVRPSSAPARPTDLLAGMPDRSRLRIEGLTRFGDRRGAATELSRDRADAVAAVITNIPPNLEHEVAGHGTEQPAVRDGEGDVSAPTAPP